MFHEVIVRVLLLLQFCCGSAVVVCKIISLLWLGDHQVVVGCCCGHHVSVGL